jgi:hypothetical protein
MNVHVIGRPGSDYRKQVDVWLGNVPLNRAQVVFNYGLQGGRLDRYLDQHPAINNLPNLNMHQFGNKYDTVAEVRDAGIRAPMVWKYRDRAGAEQANVELIVKPYYSLGGRDIRTIDSIDDITEEERRTHYIMERIRDRRYELRCICASWIDPKNWRFMKRTHDGGDDVLTWNHHTGGTFVTVNNANTGLFNRVREDVKKLLPLLGYQFGAVDFIVQNNPGGNLRHYFLEWNLAPGWTIERTEEWYKYCFDELAKQSLDQIECYEQGMLLEDTVVKKEDGGLNSGPFDNPYMRVGNDDTFEAPDWGQLMARINPAEYEQIPEHLCYSVLGAIVFDTPMTLNTIISENLMHEYQSWVCRLGHRLLVRKANYVGACPACGDEIIMEGF